MSTSFTTGDRVTFRLNEDGPAEPGVVAEVVGPTEAHPHGGEFVVLLDDNRGSVQAWHAELTVNA